MRFQSRFRVLVGKDVGSRGLLPALGLSLALHALLLWPAALPRMVMQSGQAPLAATLRSVAASALPAPQAQPAPAPSQNRVVGPAQPGRAGSGVDVAGVPGPAVYPGKASGPPGREEAVPGGMGAPAALAAEAAGIDADGIRAYRIGLAREARAHRQYPPMARERGWTGTAEVSVDVSREGRPRHILLARSSGHDVLDREAVQMMERAAASAALPDSLRGREFAVRLPVVFDLDDRL